MKPFGYKYKWNHLVTQYLFYFF